MDKSIKTSIILTAYDRMTRVINQATNNGIKSLDKFQQKYQNLGGNGVNMQNFAAGILGSEALVRPVEAFTKLEEAVSDLKASMLQAGNVIHPLFSDVEALAKRLGNFMPGNTLAITEMMNALVINGVQAKDIINGVGEATAQFAVAMNMPYSEAAEFAARLRKSTNVASEDMLKFMDVIQRTKLMGVNTTEMGLAFSRSGSSIFGMTGLENAKEMAAIFSVMVPMMQSGERAGSGMRKILSKVMNPDDIEKANALLAEKGMSMSFTDQSGKFKGLSNMVVQLEQLNKLRPDDRVKILTDIFGERGAQAGAIIAQMGVKGYNEALNRMFKQATMKQKVDEKLQSLSNRWKNAMGNMDNALAAIAEPAAPALKKVANTIADLSAKLQIFMKNHKTTGQIIAVIGITFAATAAAAGVLGIALGALQAVVAFSAGGFAFALRGIKAMQFGLFALRFHLMTTVIPALRAAGISIGAFAAKIWTSMLGALRAAGTGLIQYAIKIWSTLVPAITAGISATWAFTAALLANPITWIVIAVIAAVTALAASVYLLIKNWSKVSAFFKGAWNAVKGFFVDAWQFIKNLLLNYTAYGLIIKHWSKISAFFLQLWGNVKKIFTNVWEWIASIGSKFYNAGKNIVLAIWNGIKSLANKPVEAITNIVKKIRNFLPFSPAKEGPLKDIHRIRLIETIAESIRPTSLVNAIKKTTQAAMVSLQVGTTAKSLSAVGANGISIHFNPQISITGKGNATLKDDIMAALKDSQGDLLRLIESAIDRKKRTQF